MAHWLLKTEPETWSWDDQVKKGIEPWDGVRNHQAANNLKAMRKGETAFFYHSGAERRIVGLVEIASEAYLDPSDPAGRFVRVDVKTRQALPRPVSLADIKAEPRLAQIALVRQSRLSVMPLDKEAWALLLKMGGLA